MLRVLRRELPQNKGLRVFFICWAFWGLGACFIEKVVRCVCVRIANRHRNKP